jgi:sulfite reductase alpha subunit-like flavoprotein
MKLAAAGRRRGGAPPPGRKDVTLPPPPLLTLTVTLKRADKFQLPENTVTPMVLFGFGTGLAPFLGFIWHRRLAALSSSAAGEAVGGKKWGPVWVVASCRHLRELVYQVCYI